MLKTIKKIIHKLKRKPKQEQEFKPIALALVRRTTPELFANKLVGVQPMSQPVGLAYAMRVIYEEHRIVFDEVRIETLTLVDWIKVYINRIKHDWNYAYVRIQNYRRRNQFISQHKKIGKSIERRLNEKGMTAIKRKRP